MSSLGKLRPGPGLSRQAVTASQRERLLSAAIDLAGARDGSRMTVRGVSAAAGISTGTFYEHFASVDRCVASAVATVARRALEGCGRAASARSDRGAFGEWLRELLHWVESEPRASRFLLIDSFGADGGPSHERRRAEQRFEVSLEAFLSQSTGRIGPSSRGTVAGLTHAVRAPILASTDSTGWTSTSEVLERWVNSIHDSSVAAHIAIPKAESAAVTGRISPKSASQIGDERTRVLDAVIKLAAEQGYRSLTGPKIRAQAGVVKRRFDLLFDSVEQCFLDAVAGLTHSRVAEAQRAGSGASDWPEGVAQVSRAICRELARWPTFARLMLVEILAVGPAGLRCREALITELAKRLHSSAPPDWQSSPLEATASVAAAWRMIEAEVLMGRQAQLPRLTGVIAQVLVAPAYARRQSE
jgi:AcrR family transcriptional regulator